MMKVCVLILTMIAVLGYLYYDAFYRDKKS